MPIYWLPVLRSESGGGVATFPAQLPAGCSQSFGLAGALGLWFSAEGLALLQARVVVAEFSSLPSFS